MNRLDLCNLVTSFSLYIQIERNNMQGTRLRFIVIYVEMEQGNIKNEPF